MDLLPIKKNLNYNNLFVLNGLVKFSKYTYLFLFVVRFVIIFLISVVIFLHVSVLVLKIPLLQNGLVHPWQ